MQDIASKEDVEVVEGHMCPHGMHSWDYDGYGLVLKRTGWMSNSELILRRVSMRCSNEVLPYKQWHRHVTLIGGKAKACEKYPPKLVERILLGLQDQLREVGMMNALGGGVVCEEVNPDTESIEDNENHDDELFYDDASGASLPSDLVKKGREEKLTVIDDLIRFAPAIRTNEVSPDACYSHPGISSHVLLVCRVIPSRPFDYDQV